MHDFDQGEGSQALEARWAKDIPELFLRDGLKTNTRSINSVLRHLLLPEVTFCSCVGATPSMQSDLAPPDSLMDLGGSSVL